MRTISLNTVKTTNWQVSAFPKTPLFRASPAELLEKAKSRGEDVRDGEAWAEFEGFTRSEIQSEMAFCGREIRRGQLL